MNVSFKQFVPQPLTGITAVALGGAVLVTSWTSLATPLDVEPTQFLAWLFLIVATVCTALFRIHLRNNTKLMIATLPLFLLAVLFPPPLAASGVLLAVLGNAFVLRPQTGNYIIDIVTTIGRWTFVGWLGSSIAYLPAQNTITHLTLLVLAALAMFACDVIGTAFEVSAISGEPPLHLLRVLARELYLPEGVQYLLGIAGAIAADQDLIALVLFALPGAIVYLAFKRAKEMQESTRRILEDMADAIDLRDPYTGGHSRRVTEACRQVLAYMSYRGMEVELIISAARVHDIGKIGIPDEILSKPGALTPEERKQMETHVEIGAQLLDRYQDFVRGRAIVRHHHERWDGKGYPDGLKGMEIPLGARIIAIADSFDAMTSDRPYRRAFSREKALHILQDGSGTQWDPQIVNAFVALSTGATNPQEAVAINLPANTLNPT